MVNKEKIERYIYVWDIHWNEWFKDFVDKYDDWKTFFISTGDLFDRGKDSYWVFSTIKELYERGLFWMVLWNHDLFFIVPKVYPDHPDSATFYDQFMYNGWDNTIDSFVESLSGVSKQMRWMNPVWEDKEKEIKEEIYWMAKWLFNNFDTYYIDPLENLIIHWWIPMALSGDVIGENVNWKFISWFDYVKFLNDWFKNNDFETIRKMTSVYPTDYIFADCKSYYWWTYDHDKFYRKFYNNYLPTWFDNQTYKEDVRAMEGLRKELDKNKFKRLISGHIGNFDDKFGKEDNQDTFLQLDRSCIKMNERNWMRGIWYAILNTNNEIIEIGTY